MMHDDLLLFRKGTGTTSIKTGTDGSFLINNHHQSYKIVLLGDKASGKTSLARKFVSLNSEDEELDWAVTKNNTDQSPLHESSAFTQKYVTTTGLEVYEKSLWIHYDPKASKQSQLFPHLNRNQGKSILSKALQAGIENGLNSATSTEGTELLQVDLQIWDVSGDLIHDESLLGYILYGCNAILFCYDISSFMMFQDIVMVWYPAVQRLFSPWIPPGRDLYREEVVRRLKKRNIMAIMRGGGGSASVTASRSSVRKSGVSINGLLGAIGGAISASGIGPAKRGSVASNILFGGGTSASRDAVGATSSSRILSASGSMGSFLKSGADVSGSKSSLPHLSNFNLMESNPRESTNNEMIPFTRPTTKPFMALVGTKNDLNYIRAVKLKTHQAWASENGTFTFFTSAKNGDNVNNTFIRIACELAGIVPKKSGQEIATNVAADHGHSGNAPLAKAVPVSHSSAPENTENNCIIQ